MEAMDARIVALEAEVDRLGKIVKALELVVLTTPTSDSTISSGTYGPVTAASTITTPRDYSSNWVADAEAERNERKMNEERLKELGITVSYKLPSQHGGESPNASVCY